MNKIKLTDKKIEKVLDKDIKVEIDESNEFLRVKKIIIIPLKDTKLELVYDINEFKAEIEVLVDKNIVFDIFEINESSNVKVKYVYNIGENSILNVIKFYDAKCVKELTDINLNGKYANINYRLKTIATSSQVFDLYINHNNESTISNIVNNGVNVSGNITFNVEGIVSKGNINSETNQNNRIITFNDNECKINPKLLIDENDVVANHSALIGKFSEEELFYLESRGIDYETAVILLVKGFLLEDLEDKRLDKIIEKYWR